MTERVQAFLLRNTTSLQYLVNERLAKRSGFIGKIFKYLEIGQRQYSQHAHWRTLKLVNWAYMRSLQMFCLLRATTFSRIWIGTTHAPMNFSGLFVFFFMTRNIMDRIQFERPADFLAINQQDRPQYWFERYKIMYPPNYLNNRMSAHYLEIAHIYAVEMLKRYQVARKEILDEREKLSDQEKRTRYALNPNYIYEPLGKDSDKIAYLKAQGVF